MVTRRRRVATVATIIATAVTVMSVSRMWFPGRPFDAAGWQDDANVGSGIRQAIADRLLARRALIGKTRTEVVDLLGEPPPTEYFSDWDLVYWLGFERGFFGNDSEWLVLQFDAGHRVADARLVTD